MIENLLLSLESLRANKMRSFLTMLGIIIGIASVIAVISVGNAMTSSVTSQFAEMGVNNVSLGLQMRSSDMSEASDGAAAKVPKDTDRISNDQIAAMISRFPEIETVSLSEEAGRGKAKLGRKVSNVSLTGVNPGYAKTNKTKMTLGRYISDTDVKGTRSVIVISDRTSKALYGSNEAAIGQTLIVYTEKAIKAFVVIGVYTYVETPGMGGGGARMSEKDLETSGYIPVSTAKKDSPYKGFTSLTVVPRANTDPTVFTEKIGSYLSKQYEKNKNWESYAYNMKAELESSNKVLGTLSIALAAVAGIALVVGGIGVMNIMLVSVTERTHEIGIRKALGARDAHIRTQFVAEAIMLCVTGGLIGIATGVGLGMVGSRLLGAPFTFSPYVLAGSVLFSMFIGIFFGYYPANKAAKLNPIDALRHE